MFIPGTTATNANLPPTIMNNNLHQQQFLFDNLKDHRSHKLSSPMSRKTSATPNFSLDPDLLRELNARYLHDINSTRSTPTTTNPTLDGNGLPSFLLPPFLRAEHYHQHTHTHEHNLNISTPPTSALTNGNANHHHNSLLDKISKSDNTLSPFLRTTAANNFSSPSILPPPPPPIFPPFNLINNNNSTTTTTTTTATTTTTTTTATTTPTVNNNSTKETPSSPAKKSGKWCAAHVRISWMIYQQQQQRSKDKLSPSENKKDDEQQQSSNNRLPDLISTSKPLLPMTSASDLSLPLPSSYQGPMLPPSVFNYRSPFDFTNVNNGPFGRVPPSSSSAFGGLGSLFPPPPLPPPPLPSSSSSSIDRKGDMNGSVAAAAALGLDWSRFHRGLGPSSLIPPLTSLPPTNENLSFKKLDEIHNSNHENRKRSSSVLNNEDDRRNSHHHLMLPPSHLTNNNNNYSSSSSSSNRSRSRSPHPSTHHHHSSSSSLLNKNSSSPPPLHLSSSSSSSLRKHNSPNIKSDNLKNSIPPPSLPPTFGGSLDPLTLSIIERQRLSAAYSSLFAATSQPNNYFPGNIDPIAFRNNMNNSSALFPNFDSSAMTAALMQREHFLNSLRQQQEHALERERAAVAALNKISKLPPPPALPLTSKTEQISPKNNPEGTSRISPKTTTSPGSHSSTSSSSSSSKKAKHVKRETESSSPPSLPPPPPPPPVSVTPSSVENPDITVKQETDAEMPALTSTETAIAT